MSSETDSQESQPRPTLNQSARSPALDETDNNVSEAESSKQEGSVKSDSSSDKRSAADEIALNVDIVAVHGLLPAQSTFEDDIRELADGGTLGEWIRYKFNPDLTFSKRGFDEAAVALLREISNSRQGAQRKKRPIVFVSHDIGGSIVKRALYRASQDGEFNHITHSTKMLAFFGHPHRSLCLSDMEDKVSRLVLSDPITTPRNVTTCIRNLAANVCESNVLFLETKVLLHAELLNVYSQQEGLTKQIFDEYTSTMELSFEKIVASSKPHKELTKDALLTMAEMVRKIKNSYDEHEKSGHQRQLVRDMIVHLSPAIRPLGILPSDSHQLDSLVRHEKFIGWASSSSSAILSIDVDPRWSVLREYLFRYIMRTKKQNDTAITFSFDKYDARFGSIDALLHTTAAQWISHDPTLLELSSSELEYQRYKEVFEAYNTMDAMFMLLKLHAYGESGTNFFVLENDDDCPDMDTAFWPHVLHVMNSRERPWKFLLLRHSTRPISAWLSQWPKIQVAEQDVGIIMDSAAEGCINSTTSMYLDDTRVSQWKNCIVSCGRDVRKASLAMRFVLASSRASLPEGDDLLPQFEEQMKRDVSAIMEDILQRVSGEKRPPLDDLISLLLVAKRPLNHVELRDLSRILYRTQYASAVDFSFTDDIFNHLESNLPGVFDFTHGEVRLQHPEIRTFFLPIGDAKPKIDQLGAERTWAHICIRYIQDPSFVDISEAMSSRRKVPSQPPISSIRDNLADYAVRYWHEHMREALKRLPSEEEEALQFFQDDSVVRSLGKALHAVSNTVIEDQEIDLSPLALMACTNLKLTVKQWMKNNKDPPQVQAALTRAIKAGNLEIADVLLEHADLKEAHTAESVLLAASSLGNEEFSMFLLTTVFESCPDFQWHPRLIGRAAWLGQERLVGLMIEQKAPLYVKVLWGHGPLELSARNNHAAVVELLLAHSPGLIKRKLEDDNQTALHLAATHGYAQIIDMLIQAGADKDMKGTYRPIMMAAVYGSFSAVRALLRAGAEPEYDDRGTPWSPLSGAVRYGYNKCVEALLEDKRTNLERLSQNMTALFEAVDRGHHETCRLLLDKGAYPDNEDNAEPILVYAVAKGDFEAVKLLIEQGDPSAESRTRALLSAVQSSTNVDMVRYLVHNGADYNGKTAAGLMIHEAVSGKNVAVLDVLVEAGAKVDDVNDEGQTPLHLAYNDVAMTKRLIEIGCKTSIARPDDGFTPLHVAIEMCEWEVARTILQEGRPELELKTNSSARLAGFTPLALAVWQDHAETTRLLLEAGADPNSRTEKDGAVILQLSVDEDVVRTLLDYDPDLRLRDDKGNTPLNALVEWSSVSISVIKRLLRQGSDVNQPDKRGRTPLFKALSKTDVAITKLLLDRGADLNHVSKDEGTILHAACLRGSFEVFEFFLEKKGFTDAPYHEVGTLISAACTRPDGDEGITLQILNALRESDNWDEVKLDQVCGLFGSTLSAACFSSTENVVAWLLSNGAKTNAKDGYGRYPIHFAAYRDEPMFRMLCNAGADIEARDKTGRTVLHTAAQSGSYNLVKSILKQNKSLLTSKDDDKWIPLHYAIRGFDNHFQPRRAALDPQHQIVQLLIDELKDDDACCKTNFRVFGIEDDDWSILRFARFHGASPETRKILKKMLRKRSDGKWDKTSHETKEGSVRTYACDHCLTAIRGFVFHCRTCDNIGFCYKCYGSKEKIHEAHEWEKRGQQFVDNESSWSDEDEVIDDKRTENNEKHSIDSSSDSSSTSDDS